LQGKKIFATFVVKSKRYKYITMDMRHLINIISGHPLAEAEDAIKIAAGQVTNKDELEAFKTVIANRIKQLPDDDATAKALREIEDLLAHVHAGGKMGIINGELQRIKDPTVTAAQKLLARYIMSLDMTPQQREELFTLWREDKLINRKKLLSPGRQSFDTIVAKFNENPVIKELVRELMSMATLGQGKGEFGLSVLSKNINKPEGKGDLIIDGRKIEAKTTDGGAGRFTDQEVRPGAGFEAAARKLNDFVQGQGFTLPKSGLSLPAATEVAQQLTGKDLSQYLKMVKEVIDLVFNKTQPVDVIVSAIKSGNVNAARQEYVKANFNYYMSMKDDEGVLYINLGTEPITSIFFRDADELLKNKLRFHADTAYITSVADHRLPYPQVKIVDTSAGPAAAASTTPARNSPAAPADEPEAEPSRPRTPAPKISARQYKATKTPGVGREKR
jgi:hypothetical protein